jgi:hypothetical protein
MITNRTLSTPALLATSRTGSGYVAPVRAIPATAPVCAATATKTAPVDPTPQVGFVRVMDIAVLEGVFPGTSVLSPPI